MVNKEQFVTDYVEAVKKNDTEGTQEVLARLTAEDGFDSRIELVQDILKELKEAEGDFATTEEFLTKQIALLELAKEDEAKDSTSEEAKETNSADTEGTKAEEVTQDVAADTSADEADEKESEDSTPVAESGGYAPATEEEAEKTEQ